ncbi:hypothetical protein FRC03_011056 [Tulasnella sp. 419]|nr:hypothetical protein FRC03_011056 [Tulasnella sp. 419]
MTQTETKPDRTTNEEITPPVVKTQQKEEATCSRHEASKSSNGLHPTPPSPVTQANKPRKTSVDVQQLIQKIDWLKKENDRLRKERDEERRQRMVRDAEVESLRVYAMAANDSDGSDAVNLVKSINDSTSTLAAGLALDWSLPNKKGVPRTIQKYSILDDALLHCPTHHPQAPLLLQIAFQSYVLEWVSWIVRGAWYRGDDRIRCFVQEMEKRVQSSESQPTFARWRAITNGILLSDFAQDQRKYSDHVCQAVIRDLHYIGSLLTGCELSSKQSGIVEKQTSEAMQDIISQSIRLAVMLQTKIFNANYHVWYPLKQPFVKNDMELQYADAAPLGDEMVSAVLGLGLWKVEKVGRENVDGASEMRHKLQIMPKVMTITDIHNLISEQSISSQRSSTGNTSDSGENHNKYRPNVEERGGNK